MSSSAGLARILRRPEVGALAGAIVIFVFFSVTTDSFIKPSGASTWIFDASTFGIMAVAVALLMIGGEFDLSAGAMWGTTGLTTGILMTEYDMNVWVAILASFVVALLIGVLNGTLVVRTGLPSFIVTLGTFFVLQGVNLAVTKILINQVSVTGLQDVDGYTAGQQIFGSHVTIPIGGSDLTLYATTFWWIAVTAVATWVLLRTRAGNWIFAVGGAQTSARQVGVPVVATKVGLFVTTALAGWLVGMCSLFKITTVQSVTGVGQEFIFIICAVVGGCLLTGGYGSAGRRRVGRAHLRHGQPGHRLRGLGQQLEVRVPRRDAAGRGAGQQLGEEPGGGSAMTADETNKLTAADVPAEGEIGGASDLAGTLSAEAPELPPPGTAIIEVHDIGKSYGSVIALRDVTTSVRAAEVTCVLGDNGAGKSTLIKILAGAHEHTSGEFVVDGVERHMSSPRAALALGIATVYQDLAVVPLMPVWRNFFLGSEPTKGWGPLRRLDIDFMKKTTKTELAGDGHRPARRRPADRHAVRRRTAVRGDRSRRLLRRAGADPRRADGSARRPPVGRGAEVHRQGPRPRSRRRVHHPQPASRLPSGRPLHAAATGTEHG